jgi:hypothetical protein
MVAHEGLRVTWCGGTAGVRGAAGEVMGQIDEALRLHLAL